MSILRIKSTHKESQGEFVIIESENFDPLKHELYVETQTKEPVAENETKENPDPAPKHTKKSEYK